MIRAAASNLARVVAPCDPPDYEPLMRDWQETVEIRQQPRKTQAARALRPGRDYSTPAVAIVKHAGPCGVAAGAEGGDLAEVFSRALAADPLSAFGGIVGINRPVDGTVAETIARTRFDVLIAPSFSEE